MFRSALLASRPHSPREKDPGKGKRPMRDRPRLSPAKRLVGQHPRPATRWRQNYIDRQPPSFRRCHSQKGIPSVDLSHCGPCPRRQRIHKRFGSSSPPFSALENLYHFVEVGLDEQSIAEIFE